MINKKYIPTPIIDEKKRRQIEVVESLEGRRASIFYILKRFLSYYLRVQYRAVTNQPDIQQTANGLREIFEEFGGFWIKTGQLLALRSDIFPEEVCNELLKLQFGAVGFPMELVRTTIESELGVPLEQVFRTFNEVPLAAASIGQVHLATLRSSKKDIPVIVKVQRPGLKEFFKRDLDIIKFFVNILNALNLFSYLSLDVAIAELERIFKEELDYRYEAANARRMRKTLKDHKIYVPKIYDDFSKRQVLVMEYIEGVLMSDYIKVFKSNPAKVSQWEDENDVDPEKIGEILFISLLRQIFEDNCFHADLHPGNVILLRQNKIVLIDMGSVGSLEKDLQRSYNNYTKALGSGDFTKASDYVIRFGVDVPKVNMPRVRAEMARGFQAWSAQSELKGLDYKDKSFGAALDEVNQVALQYNIPSNWGFMKVSRSFGTLDGSLQYLVPDFNFFKAAKKYSRQSERRALKQGTQLKSFRSAVLQGIDILSEYNDLILPQIRQRTVPFELTSNIFALALVGILRSFVYLLLMGELVILYTFLYQHHFNIIESIHTQILEELVQQIPYIPYLDWVGTLIAVIVIVNTMLGVAKTLERQDYPQ
ncbi:MAG: AarF/UbiB family protein [Cyanobacteria bacterium P01_F01_bin.150]